MSTTVTMPQLGESVVEGTIGKWLVKEGDRVERDQAVVEVLTDKADSEVPSPVAGVVSKLLAKEDEVVRVGAQRRAWWRSGLIGVGAGVLSGLLGIGGGLIQTSRAFFPSP